MPPRQQRKTKLARRRGTSRRGGFLNALLGRNHPFRQTMCLLLFLAVLLTSIMLTLVVLTSNGSPVVHAPEKLSVREALRHHNVKEVGAAVKQKVDRVVEGAEIAAERVMAKAHLRLPHQETTAKISEAIHSNSNLQPYPYSLTEMPANYVIANEYEVQGGSRFTEYTSGNTPWMVTDAMKSQSDDQARSRRIYVKQAMQHAWSGYEQYAMGMDELSPQSGRGKNVWGGQGITLVDSLDTLWLMGMKDEFYRGRDWVRDHLSHENVQSVSVFETTIRDLGGLLAAYDWSHDEVFLEKAVDLGERLLRAYEGASTGLPYGEVNLQTGQHKPIPWAGSSAILAEFGTVQIENRYMSKMSGKPEFAQKTENIFEVLRKISPANGLFPYFVNNNPAGSSIPRFNNDKLTFGAMADSFYEYMLKIWIQGGKTEPMYREMYDKAMDGMHAELLQVSTPSKLTYIADKSTGNGSIDHKMDHLVCFMGGLLALGAYTDPTGLDSARAQRDLKTAKALTYTCYQMYARMGTGISPEWIKFREGNDFAPGPSGSHYLLRPETVESLFILNQLTGDPVYREWGWEIFQSIEKYCRTPHGYGELDNVNDVGRKPRDKMESFFLAETLKYLYLLLDPDTEIDILHKHVFNTEAHPTRIFPVIDQEKQ